MGVLSLNKTVRITDFPRKKLARQTRNEGVSLFIFHSIIFMEAKMHKNCNVSIPGFGNCDLFKI